MRIGTGRLHAIRYLVLAVVPLAFLVTPAERARAWENDTTRTGATYSTVPLAEEAGSLADACASLCGEDKRCRAWTLVRQGNPDLGAGEFPLCLLKDDAPQAVSDPCCISGIAGGPDGAGQAAAPETGESPGQPGPQPSAQAPGPPVHVDVTPRIFPIGKWPEGIAHDGSQLWIAMSGERRLYRVDPDSGETAGRLRVGRLPVGLASAPDGRIYAAVATDRTIWEQPPDREKGRVLARLSDYPQALTTDGQAIWVLTWVGGGSGQTMVVRIDAADGSQIQSEILPENGFDLAVSGDTVWTLHRHDGENRCEIVGLDKDSLSETARQSFSGFMTLLVAGEHGNYAGGRQPEGAGAVVRLDPATGEEAARYVGGQQIMALTTGYDYVVAADLGGTIHILTGDELQLVQTIELTTGAIRPQDILVWGDQLFMTTHVGSGDAGSLVVVDGWRP